MGEQRLGSKKGQVKNSDEEAEMRAEMGTMRAQTGSEDTGMKDEEGQKGNQKNERGRMGRNGSDGHTEIRDNKEQSGNWQRHRDGSMELSECQDGRQQRQRGEATGRQRR